jgi:hypothetical protein
MSTSLFAKLLASSKEAIEAVQIPFKERAAKLDAQKEINSLQSEVASIDLDLSKKKSEYPLQMSVILDLQDKRDLKKRRLNNMVDLFEELFETPVQEEK